MGRKRTKKKRVCNWPYGRLTNKCSYSDMNGRKYLDFVFIGNLSNIIGLVVKSPIFQSLSIILKK